MCGVEGAVCYFDILYIVQCALARKGVWGKLELVGCWGLRAVWTQRFVILINCI
jgi:hypothetical protein